MTTLEKVSDRSEDSKPRMLCSAIIHESKTLGSAGEAEISRVKQLSDLKRKSGLLRASAYDRNLIVYKICTPEAKEGAHLKSSDVEMPPKIRPSIRTL